MTLALFALAALAVWWLRSGSADPVHEFVGPTMGTSFAVRVVAELQASERERVQALVEERLDRVEGLMSTYDSASELSRLNRLESTEAFRVSAELREVLALAREVSERSGGAFDVTVAPLVEAWGFGPGGDIGGRIGPRPRGPELARLRERVGYQLLLLDATNGTVAKTHPGTRIDLSAIAKGYAVERVAAGLAELGLTRFLVEVGGELEARGTGPGGRPWRVGIEQPGDGAPGVWGSVTLTDGAIATSGDYRDYYEEDGVRYAHIVDPRSGLPLPMRGVSVTVLHARAALADAWATALTVLGPEEGLEVARREGLAAIFLRRVDGGVESLLTPAMAARDGTIEADR
jgi:thiamine biosynthesis lipoprotein